MERFDGERYVLIDGKAGKMLVDNDGEEIIRPSKMLGERAAAEYGKHVLVSGPFTFEQLDWRSRERQRLDGGDYKKLMPALAEHMVPDHFAHVSKEDPEAIAYTKTEADGIRDLKKRMRISAYLEKYAPSLDKEDRAYLEKVQKGLTACANVLWARTPDEIEKVYTHYSSEHGGVAASCMRHRMSDGNFRSSSHPVRAYGDSDLCIAYLTDKSGRTTARCVVWEEERIYSRVYGSDTSCGQLMERLEKGGYKKSAGYYGGRAGASNKSLAGARLRMIPDTRRKSHYLMPYVDECAWAEVSEDKEWAMLCGNGDERSVRFVNIKSTDGSVPFIPHRCPCCGQGRDEDEVFEDVLVDQDTGRTMPMCTTHCVPRNVVRCYGSGTRFDRRAIASVNVRGHDYLTSWAQDNMPHCDRCGSFVTGEDDLLTVRVGLRPDNIQRQCQDCYGSTVFWCEGLDMPVVTALMVQATKRSPRKRVGGTLMDRGLSLMAPQLATFGEGVYADLSELVQRQMRGETMDLVAVRRNTGKAIYNPKTQETLHYSTVEVVARLDLSQVYLAEYRPEFEPEIIRVGDIVSVRDGHGLELAADAVGQVMAIVPDGPGSAEQPYAVKLTDGRLLFAAETELTRHAGTGAFTMMEQARPFVVGDCITFMQPSSPRYGQSGEIVRIEKVYDVDEYVIRMPDGITRRARLGSDIMYQPIQLTSLAPRQEVRASA